MLRAPVEELIEYVYKYEDRRENCESDGAREKNACSW